MNLCITNEEEVEEIFDKNHAIEPFHTQIQSLSRYLLTTISKILKIQISQ